MSIASISYGSLEDASSAAKNVAKKLDKYADSLYSSVYKKLNKYEGTWNANISTAWAKTNDKITELRAEQDQYETYASDLITLCEECENTDQAVKSKIASLTSSFKKTHDIADNPVVNCIAYVVTAWGNDTVVGRWIGDKVDQFEAAEDYLKSAIKEWYNYEGGKELIKARLTLALDFAITILGILLASGTILVLAAAIVGAAIALLNAFSNYCNEVKGYIATAVYNDPATGKRRSAINTYSDYLRSSYMFGDDGETYHYNKVYNGIAFGLDATKLACDVIGIVNGLGKIVEKGFKVVPDKGFTIFQDFGRNFKSEFLDFKNIDGTFNLEGTLSSVKNILGIPKSILDDGLTISNIAKIGFNDILLPSITAFTVESNDPTLVKDPDGQFRFDFTEKVTVGTLVGLRGKKDSIINQRNSLVKIAFGEDVLNKLSSPRKISIVSPNSLPNMLVAGGGGMGGR